jgi:acetylornithine deacetylase/succinyl-diaminopimelate desuccinylase-like protein
MRRPAATLLFALAFASSLPTLAADRTSEAVAAARAFRAQHGAEILGDLAEFVAIPNVDGDTDNIGRNAEWLVRQLSARKVAASLWTTDGVSPIVWGELNVPGATRTLGIYVHYDGQPVDPSAWKATTPFSPRLYTRAIEDGGMPIELPKAGAAIDPEWRLYGRSTGDDKAPIPALLAALDALAEHGIAPTSNLRFLFEGEEEAGSPHLGDYFRGHRHLLDPVDLWLILDGPVHQSRKPQLVFGVRGVVGLEITVYGATRSLHSGHYGNWAPNPALELAQLLASMKDDRGKVLIDGYYDSTEPPGPAEREALAKLPVYDDALAAELGLVATEAPGVLLADRLLLPSLNIRGLSAAQTGERAANVIPATAVASLDLRLVKGNDPEAMLDLVEAHVRKQGYSIVREEPDRAARLAHPRIVRITREKGYPAARTALNLPIVRPVVAAATAAAGAEPPLLVPSLGGSLPLYLFTELLGKPTVIAPIANHDDNQHAPDENLRMANLWFGVDLFAALLAMD